MNNHNNGNIQKEAREQAPNSSDFIMREFVIQGKRIRAKFPKISNEKTMQLVQNMLSTSYIKRE